MALPHTYHPHIHHTQERLADTNKQLSMKVADVKRLEADLRTAKATLAKERDQANEMRTKLQEEASKVTNTAAKQVADIQSSLEKAKRTHADTQSQTAALLATHERRSAKEKHELSISCPHSNAYCAKKWKSAAAPIASRAA